VRVHVADAVRDWLAFGLSGRGSDTIRQCDILPNTYMIPALGVRKMRDLLTDGWDKWLADKAQIFSNRPLREVRPVESFSS
jgi:hypothetical protein